MFRDSVFLLSGATVSRRAELARRIRAMLDAG